MLGVLKRLFGPRKARPAAPREPDREDAPDHEAAEETAAAPAPAPEPRAPLPSVSRPPPKHAELLAMLDGGGHLRCALAGREAELLARIGRHVAAGEFALPHLPSTSVTAMDMAARPTVDIRDLVGVIATDPVMSSELLKASNSVLYGGHAPCETLHQAVVRIGLRALRSMVLSISMRGVILHDKSLAAYAEEVWRQAYSVASISRALARPLGFDPERAFLLGLLHDIGKVALLEMVRRQARPKLEVAPALLGRVFYFHHEKAGAIVAQAWKLPEEIVSVAGHHHKFAENTDHPRSAALASLAHKLDLHLSLGGDLKRLAPELDFLKVDEAARPQMLALASEALETSHAPAA